MEKPSNRRTSLSTKVQIFLSKNINCSEEILSWIAKATSTFAHLRKPPFIKRGCVYSDKDACFEESIILVPLYGSESWTMSDKNLWKLEVVHMQWLKCIFGITLRGLKRNTDIRKHICHQPPVKIMVTMNMENSRVPKQILCSD